MTGDAHQPRPWKSKDRPEVTNSRGLAGVISQWDIDELVAEYTHDLTVAPRRPERGKPFFVAEHRGRPSSGALTNRIEEHLALALFNSERRGERSPHSSGQWLEVVDYQVPLKAVRNDRIGKIDIVALLRDGTPCLIELKAPSGRGDSPFRALLELLAYAAVIEGNRIAFDAELRQQRVTTQVGAPLTPLVLGPTSWWQAWSACLPAGDWKPPFAALASGSTSPSPNSQISSPLGSPLA